MYSVNLLSWSGRGLVTVITGGSGDDGSGKWEGGRRQFWSYGNGGRCSGLNIE